MNVRNRILIVDVDERILLDLQRILEDAGFDTTITWDGGEAQAILRDHDFQLLMLCDHPPELIPNDFLSQLSSHRTLPRCVILRSPGERSSLSPGKFPSGLSAICKRNYDEVLRTVEAQFHKVHVACAS